MAFDAYGGADKLALGLWAAFVVVAYLAGAFSNYFLRRLFTADALFALVGTSTLAFLIINCFDSHGARQEFGKSVDWRLVPAGVLILFALWILAGLALACSTRLEMIPTLAVCSGVFLLGLMSDYLFGRAAGAGSWIASALYTAVPNWQLFWIADAMEGTGPVPGVWSYVAKAFAYVVCYTGAALAAALALFQDRELN
jgi:hypothetical protein